MPRYYYSKRGFIKKDNYKTHLRKVYLKPSKSISGAPTIAKG